MSGVSSDGDDEATTPKRKVKTKRKRKSSGSTSDTEEDETFIRSLRKKKRSVRDGSHEDSGQFSNQKDSSELSEVDYDEDEDREFRRLVFF